MNDLHDLLDLVSAEVPRPRISVDDLVRAGRRRQHTLAAGAVGGTLAVTAVAAVGLISSHGRGSGPQTTDSSTAVVPTSPKQVAIQGIDGPAGSTVAIPAIQVLDGRKIHVDGVVTSACERPSRLAVVSQSNAEVVLSLTLGASTSAPSCAPRPTQVVHRDFPNGSDSNGVDELALTSPLDGRRLVDASTGQAIPYETDAVLARPYPLPSGWLAEQSTTAMDGEWLQTWNDNAAAQVISLVQRRQAPDPHPYPTSNATVWGQPASISAAAETGNEIEVAWYAYGWRFDLTISELGAGCTVPPTGRAVVQCAPASGAQKMTTSSVLAIANSFVLPQQARKR